MLWLCARFPQLPVEVFGHSEQPCAVMLKRKVLTGNAAAQASGVRVGQSLSTAQSLCPELRSHERDVRREQQRLQQLALWAYRFTPDIYLQEPHILLMNIGGSLRLFKGITPLVRSFARGLRRRHIELRLGLGHTPLAAELLSHYRGRPSTLLAQGELDRSSVDALLQQLPLRLLPCSQRIKDRLDAMGLKRMADLQPLPRATLNRRFGTEFGQLLARINGEQADLRERFAPPDEFFSERLFNDVLNNKQQLTFPMSAMLHELESYLRIKQQINRELCWELGYSDHSSENIFLHCSQQRFDRRGLLNLSTLKLEQFSLKGPIDRLALHCKNFTDLEVEHRELFEPEPRDQDLQGVIDKLRVRLGHEACRYPQRCDEHLPEQAGVYHAEVQAERKPAAAPALHRPFWLLPDPLPVHTRRQGLYWRGQLELLQGPERIDHGWWQQRQVRDYYIAQHENGALCWLYKDCLNQRWYLHGLFG